MAKRVIDILELVDINHQNADLAARNMIRDQLGVKVILKLLAIGQTGKIIVMRAALEIDLNLAQRQFGIHLIGHIATGHHDLFLIGLGAEIQHRKTLLVPEHLTIAPHVPVKLIAAKQRAFGIIAKPLNRIPVGAFIVRQDKVLRLAAAHFLKAPAVHVLAGRVRPFDPRLDILHHDAIASLFKDQPIDRLHRLKALRAI